MEPTFNKETRMYEVMLYAHIHEFYTKQEAWDFLNRAMEDWFSDSVCDGNVDVRVWGD